MQNTKQNTSRPNAEIQEVTLFPVIVYLIYVCL